MSCDFTDFFICVNPEVKPLRISADKNPWNLITINNVPAMVLTYGQKKIQKEGV